MDLRKKFDSHSHDSQSCSSALQKGLGCTDFVLASSTLLGVAAIPKKYSTLSCLHIADVKYVYIVSDALGLVFSFLKSTLVKDEEG